MRTRLAPALLLAGCASVTATEASPFRDALAAGGGCGRHRALADERLGPLAGARPSGERDVDLFGKPASAWSEAEIRDARAAFAACEARASGGDPELTRRFETALRRLVVLAQAREPAQEASGAPSQRAADGEARRAPAPGERGMRQGPAFIPAKGGTAPRDPGQQAAEVFRDAERIERAESAMAVALPLAAAGEQPAERPDAAPETGPAGTGARGERGPRLAVAAAFGGPRNASPFDLGEPKPARGPNCAVSLRSFEMLQAEMRMTEVESLLGCRGASDGSTKIPGLGAFETYSWTDRGGTFSVTLVFQHQRLKSKAQRGLVN
jgi:hypothetical protein